MDSFLTACGADRPLTFEIEGPGYAVPDRRTFAQPYFLIGRDDRSDLVLDHDAVSRRHVYLQLIEGRIYFIDLDSRTGTAAGEGTVESGWLDPGRGLSVGPYTVRPVPSPGAEVEPAPRPSPMLARSNETSGLPRVTLEFQSRTSGHSVWKMSQTLILVGSSPRCKVRLLDSKVSKLHCALVRTAKGLWTVDLMGRGGITVNNVPVRSARLRPGDYLGLGQVVVRPSFDDPSQAAAPLPVARPARPARPPAPAAHSYNATPAEFPPPAVVETQGGPPNPLGAADPALGMLLGHFGQMQQQMLDQFQQSMMMMLQMFTGMHREQMGLVREELDRLRELNNEIATIKAEIRAKPPAPVAPPAPPGWPVYRPPIVPPSHQHQPAAPGPPVPAPQMSSPADPPPVQPVPAADPVPDVHDWLHERLTAITDEQQTRWQKLMTLLRNPQ